MDRHHKQPAPPPARRPTPARNDPSGGCRWPAESPELEPADVLRLQQAVGNQQVQRLVVQRSNPADPRLPASQAEALSRAREAKQAIDAAIAAMRTSAVPEQRNAAQFIAQKNWTPAALTPRHDSTLLAPAIHFFPGQNNYTGSQTLDAQTTHKVSPKRTWVYVRARDHANVDSPLAQADIQARIAAAVSEIAHIKAAHSGQPVTIDLYRARFNGLFDVPPFNALGTAPNPALDSRGPRTPRARAIFERILAEDPAVRAAYDGNTGGIRETIDAYAGPEGMNRVNSPRLQRLREAFFAFRVPVPAADYPRFRNAIRTASTGLDAADRKAVDDSNEWQQLINAHVLEEGKRADIRAVISGQPLTPDRAAFLAAWRMTARVAGGPGSQPVTAGMTVRYRDRTLQFRVAAELPSGQKNTGLVLFVRSSALRGSTVVAVSRTEAFPPRGEALRTSPLFIAEPAAVPAAGEPLTIRLELLEADQTTVIATKTLSVTATAGSTFTKAQAISAATQDQTFFRDNSPNGLLGKLTAAGGHGARVAEAVRAGSITIEPLTPRHDSEAYVAAHGGPDPSQIGLFHGVTYGDLSDTVTSMTRSPSVLGTTPAHGVVWVKRTFDVASNGKFDDAKVIDTVIHEAVHALDAPVHRQNATDLEHYKTEFRAFWLDGTFGPPDRAGCPTPPGNCRPTAVDPSMPAPGPKSPRARAIFDHLYQIYPFVKSDYDNNVDGFREAVDRYVWPDGINLIVSPRLDRLQQLISGWNGTNFAGLRTEVRRFAGVGPAPAGGRLNPQDQQEISNNRAWRDLVEEKVPDPGERRTLKTDLGIPL